MVLVYGVIYLNMPQIKTIKGKRAVVNSLKDKLKNRNISLLDISSSYNKEAEIAFCFLASNQKAKQQFLFKLERLLERDFGEFEFDIEYEDI